MTCHIKSGHNEQGMKQKSLLYHFLSVFSNGNMLSKILTHEACANCKECCVFSRYDTWEQPALNPENRQKAEKLIPESRFVSKGKESCIFRIREDYPEDLFLCPLLDSETGCLLGEEKPFECQIYPFQVMKIDNHIGLVLSPLCEIVMKKPFQFLLEFAREELAGKVFAYARQHPDIIRKYDGMSPVLVFMPE